MNCSVYVLQSKKNGSYYVGSAVDPQTRLADHNLGKTTYTSRNRPFELVFQQKFESVSKARTIEQRIKSWKRRDFIEKIITDGGIRSA